MKEFKDKLKELLLEYNNISPEKLEKELSKKNLFVSANAIRGYLNGIAPKSIEYYMNLASFFNVSPLYLIDNNIENRDFNNIDIGKELNLSDESIKNIKNVKDKKILNYFFENSNFSMLIYQFSLFFNIEKIINYDLKIILYVCDIFEYIMECNKTGKQNNLDEYFTKCDNAINSIVNFTNNTEFFDPSDSKYDLFSQAYEAFKDSFYSNWIEDDSECSDLCGYCDDMLDLFDEITKKYELYSKIIKLNIDNLIYNYIYELENVYDVSLSSIDYTEILGKYIKHLNKFEPINKDIKNSYNIVKQKLNKQEEKNKQKLNKLKKAD